MAVQAREPENAVRLDARSAACHDRHQEALCQGGQYSTGRLPSRLFTVPERYRPRPCKVGAISFAHPKLQEPSDGLLLGAF